MNIKQTLQILLCLLVVAFVQCIDASGQEKQQITGNVTDTQGLPLVGVVVVDISSTGGVATRDNVAVTDEEGNWSLNVEDVSRAVLKFQLIGMISLTTEVRGRVRVDVTLEEDSIGLDQVVVTGYKTLNRRELSSAVAYLTMDQFALDGAMTVDQMLMGQVAGMAVTRTSGTPGAAAKIRIRGTSSIIGNKSPLWVLDGIILDDPVEVDHSDLTGEDAEYLVGNAIAGINPHDIESITILKDASATAIYGIQAANGVIVVTTKKGQNGRLHVDYNGTVSYQQRENYNRLNLMSAYQRVMLSKEIIDDNLHYDRTQSSLTIGYEGLLNQYESKGLNRQELKDEITKMVNRNTDWLGILYRDAITQSHSVSVSGGNDDTTYYTSLGVDYQPGQAREEQANRYTIMAKLNSWVHPKVYLGFQFNGTLTENKGYHTSVNPKTYAYQTARTIPCYNDDGSLFYYEPYATLGSGRDALTLNILDETSNTGSSSSVANVTAKMNLVWNIWGGFKYELQASYIYSQTTKNIWANSDSYYVSTIRGYSRDYDMQINSDEWEDTALPQGGTLDYYNNRVQTYDVRNQIGFNRDFNKDHVVSVLAISEVRSSKTDGLSALYYGYMPERGKTISPAYTTKYESYLTAGRFAPVITDNIKNVVSLRGVASYSYKDKYGLNGSISMDGSNQFGSNPEYRFLPIWSVSGKWTISEEPFLKNSRQIDYLALRLSYGIQGNVDSATSPDLVLKIGDISSETGLAESTVSYWPNADLRWEKTTSYNVGLDFAMVSNRINGTLDFYHKAGTDMIMDKVISGVNGITTYKINAGDIDNTGAEITLGGYPIRTQTWSLNVQFIYSYNRNVLTKANSEAAATITNSEKIAGTALIVGEALGTLYSYDFAGLDHDTGLPIFRDTNGESTTVIDGEEVPNYTLYESELGLVKSGKSTPPTTGGINIGLRHKNWHLNASFTYTLGGVARLPSLYNGSTSRVFDPEYNMTTDIIDRWREPGDEEYTDVPVLYDDYSYNGLILRPLDSSMGSIYKGSALYDYSSVRVCSTDNFRMRSLSVSYNFPAEKIKRLNMTALSLRLSATNLFIIANKRWHGFDPELGSSATSPIPRVYTLNVNISF